MPPRRFSDAEELDIVEKYQSGKSYYLIAKDMNVPAATVLGVLIRNNIPRRSNSVSHRVYKINESAFDKLDNELTCYWLGFIYADGTVANGRNQVTVALQLSDKPHLERLATFLGQTPVRIQKQFYNGVQRPHCSLSIRSTHMADRLRELGIVPHRPQPEKCFLNVPDRMKWHWLRGWIDGDGSPFVTADGKFRVSIIGRVSMLKVATRWLNVVLGMTVPKIEYKPNRIGIIDYGKSDECRILYWYMYRYATIYLERKMDKFINHFGRIADFGITPLLL